MSWRSLLLLAGLAGCAPDSGESGTTKDAPTSDQDDDGYAAAYDCNDYDAEVNPGAAEVWYDGVDQDCSGGSDFDADADGQDRVPEGADCDDAQPEVFAGATEVCDEVDNNCDGRVDTDAVDVVSLYRDEDADGWGVGNPTGTACVASAGQATQAGDCDDGAPDVNPGAVEACDGRDEDCDGFVDDEPTDGLLYFADADRDGFGDVEHPAVACAPPDGYVANDGDCDDTDALTWPGAPEWCDLEDNNCNGVVDENAVDPRTYYADDDGDGYGRDDTTAAACGVPVGYAEVGGDCADTDPAVSPATVELCNGTDDNCNGVVDVDSPDALALFPDADGDGYGDGGEELRSCTAVAGFVADGSDCDDGDSSVHPLATESCDEVDNDCDGVVDPYGSAGSLTWYVDRDFDGYGDAATSILACTQPYGYAASADDCDDAVAAANPGNRESCDSIDNNCDGVVDESTAVDAPSWYADTDGDGYGDPAVVSPGCTTPPGYVASDADCDDADPAVNPLAAEVDNQGDEDCDGLVDEDFVAVGDVVVTEIARQPYTGGSGTATNADAQWFELTNTSSRTIDLRGWYFAEQDGDDFTVSPDAGLTLDPGASLVFCYADTWFATPATCAYPWGDASWSSPYYDATFYFDRDEDLLGVYLDGTLLDEVHWYYDATNGYWPRVARYSMEFDGAAAQDPATNDDVAEWCLADATIYSSSTSTGYPDYGTPGTANGACP